MKKCLYCDEMIEDNKNVCDKNYCRETYYKFNKPPNVKCSYCGIEFYLKPYRLKRAKHIYVVQKNVAINSKKQP